MTTNDRGMTRRGFLGRILQGGAALGLGAAALGGSGTLSRLARAAGEAPQAGAPDRHYIFCYFSGGWDVLLSLDPRDPQVFTGSTLAATRIQPAYELLQNNTNLPYRDVLGDGSMFLGPYVGELADQADRLCVVRGMSMDTLTHEVGRRRFLTGRPPSGLAARGSSTDTWLAARLGADQPVPNLSIRVESYNYGDLPNYATALRTNGIDDLLRVLRPTGATLDDLQTAQLDALIQNAAECPTGRRSEIWTAAALARTKSREMVAGDLSSLFDFRANTPSMQALRAHYGFTTSQLGSSGAMAAMAATAIMSGVSRAVSIGITSRSLDTHFANWQTDQGPTQAEAFTAVARLMTHLESVAYPDDSGDSWLDRTVIVGFSEFSRTPLLNAQGGRDHWLGNSCFLAGAKIAGGRVIGGSSNIGMNPLPVDLASGVACALDADHAVPCPVGGGVEVVRPEHILQALYREIGMTEDQPDLRVKPLTAIFA